MKFIDFVTQTLTATSDIARSNFGRGGWTLKEDYNQVLTATDGEIGHYIISQIQKYFPTHSIIDEEAGVIDRKSEYIWVVDPIDGTSNFAFGVPTYGTMIGLLYKDKPLVGGLSLPEFKEIYYAESGHGCLCNGQPIKVTSETDLSRVLVSYSIDSDRAHSELTDKECLLASKIINQVRSLRMSNSVFDTTMVLSGHYGAYLMTHSKIWDNVAQQILITEANGVYTDFYGQPISYANALNRTSENFTFCAAAPAIHSQLQKTIAQS